MSEQTHVALGDYANGSGNGNGRFRVSWQTVLGWVVTAMLAYAAVEARVRVLEFQYTTLSEDLREIKADIKSIMRDRGIK